MSQARPIIEFKQFSFRYDSQADFNLIDIDAAVYEGETILVVGPSGSGKSTLAKAINGQIPNSFQGEQKGQVTVKGQDTRSASLFELSLSVGTVLQDADAQFVGLTVAEDLAFSLENDQVDQAKMQEAVNQWAATLNIQALKNNSPQELSGGQKQRVSIGGVLIDQVPILLFDEPLANLDPQAGLETLELINRLSQDLNLTTIIIEHRLEECLHAAIDRVWVIDQGRLVADQTVDELLRSDLLDQTGLRQPLYLDALKQSNYPLERIRQLGAYSQTDLPAEALVQVQDWISQLDQIEKRTPSPDPDSAILKVDQLGFAYPRQTTPSLQDISFSIQPGEMVSIIGTNGAGKSTLAKLICGFERPDQGSIEIQGQDQSTLSIKEIADQVGYVMQNPNQMISKTHVYDELALGLVNRGVDSAEIKEQVMDTLKVCGLYPYRNWPISALSYGQKRRVTIGSILVLNPAILILDEPTAGQDYRHYRVMMDFLTQLNQDYHMTLLMVTHDMHLMQEYTKRTLAFDQGQLVADSRPAQIFAEAELMERASLVPTSLYYLGQDLPDLDVHDFLDRYMALERGKKDVN